MKKRNRVVLVLGGARSGKSAYAMRLALKWFRKPLYLATAEAGDREMAERISRHKKSRGPCWKCIEEPLNIASILANPPPCDGILVDCLTLWVSNVLLKEKQKGFEKRRAELVRALSKAKCPVILVSNEVGMGIVPAHRLGRAFRDLAGWLNQDLASSADTVVFVVSGLPVILKGRMDKHKKETQNE